MRIADSNWMQVENRLLTDDRCVLPLGCTEQHAYLRLATDSILAGKVAQEAAEPLGVPVFPVVSYGMTPLFLSYPGTVSIPAVVYISFVVSILDSLHHQGFRRILIVNGHGGNTPARTAVADWVGHNEARVLWHDWWSAPLVWAKVKETDPDASHASWMENFPWTRVEGVQSPLTKKPMANIEPLRLAEPPAVREALGDGSFGGLYQRSDDEMSAIWEIAVRETRTMIDSL